jgi:hypothetical protein
LYTTNMLARVPHFNGDTRKRGKDSLLRQLRGRYGVRFVPELQGCYT